MRSERDTIRAGGAGTHDRADPGSWGRLLGLAALPAVLLGLVNPTRAYIDATPTLGRMVQDATHIAVLQVDRVHPEKRLILYRKVADLKGRLEGAEIKHRITEGTHPREPKMIMEWAEPGKTALMLGNDRMALICIGPYWYECAVQETPWWNMTRGRPELSLAYYGSAAALRDHLAALLAGKEVVVGAILHCIERWQAFGPVVFKQALRGSKVPVGRVKVRLGMPDHVGELIDDPRYVLGSGARIPGEIAPLCKALEDSRRGVRVEAAEGLAMLGRDVRAAAPALLKALQDTEPMVRIRAAGALARTGRHQDAILPVLLAALKEPNGATRKAAVETLGEIGSHAPAAVAALTAALADPEPGIRWAALESLGQFEYAAQPAVPAVLPLVKDPQTRILAVDVLGSIGPGARMVVPQLAVFCKDTDPNLRWSAAVALMRILVEKADEQSLRPALAVFLETLRSPDAEARWRAVFCLKWLGTHALAGVPEMITLARDPRPVVRAAANEALAELGPPAREALPALRENLKDDDWDVRISAAEAVWRIAEDSQPALTVCVAALTESDNPNRILASKVLRAMGPHARAADRTLVAMLADEDRLVRRTAASALSAIGPGAERTEDLIRAMQSKDPQVRADVAELLGKFCPESRTAVQALVHALKDGDLYVRLAAAKSLAKTLPDAPELVPALGKLLDEAEVRQRAMDLLGKLGGHARSAAPLLTPLLRDDHPDVRSRASELLRELGNDGAAPPAPVASSDFTHEKSPGPSATLPLAIAVGTGLTVAVAVVAVSRRRRRPPSMKLPG